MMNPFALFGDIIRAMMPAHPGPKPQPPRMPCSHEWIYFADWNLRACAICERYERTTARCPVAPDRESAGTVDATTKA
jgi:hypothetical protein